MSKNVGTLKSGSAVIDSGTIRMIVYGFLLVFKSNFVPDAPFFEIFNL